jgi:predicted Fe-Mo cluster-binding NifX family protein
MKIAFPTAADQGMDSPVYGHFGTAPCFIVVESDEDRFESFQNQDLGHAHGQCQPLKALGNMPLDAVVVGGIGGGALNRLNAAGIKTFRAVEGTVRENLELIRSGKLPEYTLMHTCGGHESGGHCAH